MSHHYERVTQMSWFTLLGLILKPKKNCFWIQKEPKWLFLKYLFFVKNI